MHPFLNLVILTRSWTKPHSSIAGECTMVPILDLLNHDDQGGGLIAVAFDDQPGMIHSFGVLATKDVGTDEEVFDSYDPPTSPNQIKCMQDMEKMLKQGPMLKQKKEF